MFLPEQPDWFLEALCAQTDPELFYPEKGGPVAEAIKICQSCPVTAACLQYALDNDERFGVWGGTSPVDRKKLRQGQRLRRPDYNDWHGKPNGVRKHWVLGEPACEPCRKANRIYRQELAARKAG